MDSAQKRNLPICEGAMIRSADPVVPEKASDVQEVPGEAYVTPPVQTSVASPKTPVDGSHIAIPSVNSTAQSGTPAVTPPVLQLAAQRYIVDINGLVPTKSIHFNIVVRVMTIWKMYNTQNKKDVKSLELSLIDAQGSKIQATIPARIMKDFVKYFKDEGKLRILLPTLTIVVIWIYLNDMNIADIYEYKHRMEQEEIKSARIQKISLLSSISGYTTELDQIQTAGYTTELDQGCNVVVFAKISGLAKENEWSYTDCSLCNRKVFEIEDAEKNNGGNKKLSFAITIL
ncbi:OLC1v1029723C1 [Oldenlandia corymbosa var. corymbosa]|uniref:OLC1v1029723C1 n=1 Tax=Oldenlandia corymbosa var. corymbosa TaxID=529605 RepID=A0AAV1CHT5_OLDCO|nr:OLC1v1029723C1 [Oldenlandia corymbosa var. corymbosa]